MSAGVNLILSAVLVGAGLYLVHLSYEARQLTAAIDRSGAEAQRLGQEYQRLDAERQAQATHQRVERIAREQLGMRSPTPGVMIVVADTAPAGAVR